MLHRKMVDLEIDRHLEPTVLPQAGKIVTGVIVIVGLYDRTSRYKKT
jgi:hypothetical protein